MTAWVRPGTPAERARRCGEWSASEFESFASAPAAYPKTRYKPCWRRVRRAGRAVVGGGAAAPPGRSEEHTSELQSRENLVCRLLLEKKNTQKHEDRHCGAESYV